jgi:CheY-like chemotaxis protein
MRILVVDDNAAGREILTGRLASWGMRVTGTPDGHVALKALEEASAGDDPYLFALVDLQMPGMDGVSLVSAIRQNSRLTATSILTMSPLGLRPDGPRAEQLKGTLSLSKPVRHTDLAEVLSRARNGETEPAPRQEPRPEDRTPEPQARGGAGATGVRILLAEDNSVNQQVALAILKKLGYRADAVANGIEALNALGTIPYDVVLMDVQMPEMDGMEATRAIRDRRSSVLDHDIPIIAMTAHAMQGDRERCLEAGMTDYVSKPVMRQAVAEALQRCLERKKKPAAEPG